MFWLLEIFQCMPTTKPSTRLPALCALGHSQLLAKLPSLFGPFAPLAGYWRGGEKWDPIASGFRGLPLVIPPACFALLLQCCTGLSPLPSYDRQGVETSLRNNRGSLRKTSGDSKPGIPVRVKLHTGENPPKPYVHASRDRFSPSTEVRGGPWDG